MRKTGSQSYNQYNAKDTEEQKQAYPGNYSLFMITESVNQLILAICQLKLVHLKKQVHFHKNHVLIC